MSVEKPAAKADLEYSLVSDFSKEMVSVLTPDGFYKYASPRYPEVLGWKPSELVGRNAYDFFHQDDVSRILRDHAGSIVKEGRDNQVVVYRMRTKDGPYRWVETKTTTLRDGEGAAYALFCATRDLEQDVSEVTRLRLLLYCSEAKSERDAMTGLWNKAASQELLEFQLAIASNRKRTTTVAIVDIDHFKRINDAYGHPIGDKVIEYAAAVLKSSVRNGDIVGRYGGEEFLVILRNAEHDEALAALQRVRRNFEMISGPMNIVTTVSIGYATVLESNRSLRQIVETADKSLYRAKESGRNRVCGEVLG